MSHFSFWKMTESLVGFEQHILAKEVVLGKFSLSLSFFKWKSYYCPLTSLALKFASSAPTTITLGREE